MLLRCRPSLSHCAAAAAFTYAAAAADVAWHLIMKCDQGSSTARTRPSLFLCQRQRRRRVHVSAQSKAPSVVHCMSFAFACKWLCVCVYEYPRPFWAVTECVRNKSGKANWIQVRHTHTHLHIAFSFSVLLKMCHVKRKCSTVRRKKKGNGANTAETLSHVTSCTHTHILLYSYISVSFFAHFWQPLCTRALANYAHTQTYIDTLYVLWKACASQMTLIRQ